MFKFISLAIFVFAFNFITCSARLDWYEFNSSEFSITFPDKPDSTQIGFSSEYGDLPLTMIFYNSKSIDEDNYAYILSFTDYPDTLSDTQKENVLNNYCREYFNSPKTYEIILPEVKIKHGKYQGREVKVYYKKGDNSIETKAIITMRIYLVKNRMYMIQVMSSTKKDSNKSIIKFFDSFNPLE